MTGASVWHSPRKTREKMPSVGRQTHFLPEQMPEIDYRGIQSYRYQGSGSRVRGDPLRPSLRRGSVELPLQSRKLISNPTSHTNNRDCGIFPCSHSIRRCLPGASVRLATVRPQICHHLLPDSRPRSSEVVRSGGDGPTPGDFCQPERGFVRWRGGS